ncbi:MAG TPA: PEP-CTERM sorting domain-containing protein, partial [Chthoniobacterales bacterium]
DGAAVGAQYDQTEVTGSVSLGNATLSLKLGFSAAAGDMFNVINNDGSDAVTGTFDGLAEGAIFTAGEQTFAISYQGGDGNDVVLTSVVPEPGTRTLLSAGAALLAWAGRRRRGSS